MITRSSSVVILVNLCLASTLGARIKGFLSSGEWHIGRNFLKLDER